jgi:hypothetical protein
MAFMKHDIQFFTAWQVDTTHGMQIIPTDVCGDEPGPDDIDGTAYDDPEKVQGWFCRLDAPGYMDCTDWSGPYDTKDEAIEALEDMYPEEDEDIEASRW